MSEMTAEIPAFPMPRATQCPFDPSPDLREIQAQTDLARVRLWDDSVAWLVTDYELGRNLLLDPRLSSNPTRAGFPHMTNWTAAAMKGMQQLSFVHKDEPEHGAERRTLNKDFTIRRMEALRPRIQRVVDELIDQMLAGPNPVDFVEALALPVPSLAISELLGVPYDDRELFQHCSHVMASGIASQEEMVGARMQLREYLFGLVKSKLDNPGDDLLSRLAVEQVGSGAFTAEEVTDMAVLLLFAGHETTANQIALGTLALLGHPDQLEELRCSDDPGLLASAVEEILRFASIGQMGRRRVATADIPVGDRVIREGEGVIVAGDVANRDAGAFPEPDRLDIHREARHHVAFGYGVHQCLGQPLARMELKVVFGTLFRRIPTLQVAVPFEALRFKEGNLNYGVHELPVTW